MILEHVVEQLAELDSELFTGPADVEASVTARPVPVCPKGVSPQQ